jgi:hypothetical protein
MLLFLHFLNRSNPQGWSLHHTTLLSGSTAEAYVNPHRRPHNLASLHALRASRYPHSLCALRARYPQVGLQQDLFLAGAKRARTAPCVPRKEAARPRTQGGFRPQHMLGPGAWQAPPFWQEQPLQGYLPPLWDPSVALCLGTYAGVPR